MPPVAMVTGEVMGGVLPASQAVAGWDYCLPTADHAPSKSRPLLRQMVCTVGERTLCLLRVSVAKQDSVAKQRSSTCFSAFVLLNFILLFLCLDYTLCV